MTELSPAAQPCRSYPETMTEHNRDKDQENYLIDQARTIHDEIEVSVFGPSGIETPPCAEALTTAKLIADLRARVEALENAKRVALSEPVPSPTAPLNLKEQAIQRLNQIEKLIADLEKVGLVPFHDKDDSLRRALKSIPDPS